MTDKLAIFDLDGTLIDTSYDLLDSLNYCLQSVDLNTVKYEDLTYLVGQGARAMLSRAFDLNKTRVDDPELDRLVAVFVEHYRDNMPGKSELYPELLEALDRLDEGGFQFAICTNKMESLAAKLIDELSLAERFPVLTGGDTFSFRKPDARHILKTAEFAGVSAENTLMIGDSVNDIEAAKNADIPSIAVSFGYSHIPVEELGADLIITNYGELTSELAVDLLKRS